MDKTTAIRKVRHITRKPGKIRNIKLCNGWFHSTDGYILYHCARIADGPVLEIGSWVGRSTVFIANGVKASKHKKDFYTVDLHLDSLDDISSHFNPLGLGKSKVGLRGYKKYIDAGGSLNVLKNNLKKCGVLGWVNVLKGDFAEVAPKLKYGMVFTDATHNQAEINVTVPPLKDLVCSGTILACHDILNQDMEDMITQHIPLAFSTRTRRLLVGIVN